MIWALLLVVVFSLATVAGAILLSVSTPVLLMLAYGAALVVVITLLAITLFLVRRPLTVVVNLDLVESDDDGYADYLSDLQEESAAARDRAIDQLRELNPALTDEQATAIIDRRAQEEDKREPR